MKVLEYFGTEALLHLEYLPWDADGGATGVPGPVAIQVRELARLGHGHRWQHECHRVLSAKHGFALFFDQDPRGMVTTV